MRSSASKIYFIFWSRPLPGSVPDFSWHGCLLFFVLPNIVSPPLYLLDFTIIMYLYFLHCISDLLGKYITCLIRIYIPHGLQQSQEDRHSVYYYWIENNAVICSHYVHNTEFKNHTVTENKTSHFALSQVHDYYDHANIFLIWSP